MKVLILGSGGREHALAWAVERSPRVTEIVCAPGNGGIGQVARCVPVDLKDVDAMVRLGRSGAAEPDHRRAGTCRSRWALWMLFASAAMRVFGPTRDAAHAGVEQGLCQAVHAAAQDSHGQLRRLHQRQKRLEERLSFHRADRGESRWAGRGQGRGDLPVAPLGARSGTGAVHRSAAWRG